MFLTALQTKIIRAMNEKMKRVFEKFQISSKKTALIFLLIFLIEFIFILEIFDFSSVSRFLASIYPDVLINLTNDYRQQKALSALVVNPVLEEAARLKAQDMAQNGYFAHTSPDGIDPWYWLDKVGYDFVCAGENLAVNFSDSSMLHQAWIDSLSHRENIINKNFSEIGIATAQGLYRGKEAVFVVQFFGRQKRQVLASPTEKKETKGDTQKENSRTPLPIGKIDSKIILGENAAKENNFENISDILQKEESFVLKDKLEETPLPQKINYYSSFFSRIFSESSNILIFFGISFLVLISALLLADISLSKPIKPAVLTLNSILLLFLVSVALLLNHFLILICQKIV